MCNDPPKNITKNHHPGYFKSICVVDGKEVVRFYPIRDILPMLYKEKVTQLPKALFNQVK